MTVADASPLIVFARAQRFSLLQELLTNVLIPRAVHKEVVVQGGTRPGAREVAQATWIEVVEVTARTLLRRLPRALGRGEREAIALAHERHLTLYSDDLPARNAARAVGVTVFGTLGLLEAAKRAGQLTHVRPIAEGLVQAGLRLRQDLYQAWLQRVQE
jgi:predicted nucleic acid-binding protein